MAPASFADQNEIDVGHKVLTILGCGSLGTAILSGILASRNASSSTSEDQPSPGTTFKRFIACVRRDEAVAAVKDKLAAYADTSNVEVLNRQNLKGVKQADTVLLACQPEWYQAIFDEPGMQRAMEGKLIVSVLAGVTTQLIQSALGGDEGLYFVVRAMPNTACFVRDSTTVIETPQPNLSQSLLATAESIFRCVGQVSYVKPSTFNVCTAVCGSSPAFFSVIIDAMVDGAVAMGLNHADALRMAAFTMRGTANMLANGRDPRQVRFEVASPAGSTMQGLLALEEGKVRSVVSNALIAATTAAAGLGSKDQRS
ncbi:pyrroline-5-carboxylate reductase [Lindgomyces ingoldianus]|uniref:Pyrroline-5-carboxylate reductase n=1 Tax=Lindgomyces ingoldianus TaxID=673940 RepID=A0ACB6Q6X9_9PLEO|nr:pyrroline-5-carboxylate reductase [Lindgomyces ingoldianus]KAF2462704.1 pyrroline-5-carboxylate reductase [Lindgomyces ingoldianus]